MINRLEEMGISPADVKKMQEGGFNTVECVVFTAKKNMLNIKGLTEGKIDKIIEAANKLVKNEFMTAKEFQQKRDCVL